MSEPMTDEELDTIRRTWKAYAENKGVSVGWLVEQIPKCLKEIDRLKASAIPKRIAKLEEENRKLRELLASWRKWRGKDVTYTGGDNPSPFGETCALLDGDKQ